MHRTIVLLLAPLALDLAIAHAEEPAKYRTDANGDISLPWFQPDPGEFPPADAAHYVSGEFVGGDHVERIVKLRVDRNDDQSRDEFDHSITATMLPYGSVYVHGQPAALRDIPIGTHLHGWLFERPEGEQKHWEFVRGKRRNVFNRRESPEIDFTRCLRLEDDFSYHTRRGRVWRVDAVEPTERRLIATLERNGKAIGDPREFDLLSSTVVLQGDGFGTLGSIEPGQRVQMNVTWATLYGPGRVLRIWLDEKSRSLAAARQLERHRNHVRERGIPGWVDAVDDEKKVVTVTFFDGIDPTLFEDLKIIVPEPLGWPTSGGAKNDLAPKGTIAVATDARVTFDPVNDRKGGNILETKNVPVVPGCSGVRIRVQCGMLLEGYRPTKVVRFYPASWKVVALPREESYFGKE